MNVVHIEAGEGEPVLLLHGYPQSASCWRHQIPALAEHHRVIAADWPGFGRAEPPDTPATYDAEVERIGRLADSFGLDRFNLVGLAAGLGRIACPTAIIWGDRDRYIPFSTAHELAENIPSATLNQLTGGDHYIMEERPDEVTAALLGLLARPCVVSPAAGIRRYPR